MVIQIDGGASTNKGAQLMMVAVIQEIKQRFPDTKLVINNNNPDESFIRNLYGGKVQILRSKSFYRNVSRLHLVKLAGVFSRKFACFFTVKNAVKGANIVFNIGGFQFGDQWHHNKTNIENWKDYLSKLHEYGSKYVFLPQAFGPFEKRSSKMMLEVLNNNADILIARDDISYNYLMMGNVNKKKVMLYPDFTASVKGKDTEYSRQNKGKVCIIPNSKIIQSGIMNKDAYLTSLEKVIGHIYEKGYQVVLLNHEGVEDYKLCKTVSSNTSHDVSIVSGLNSVETKGVIASSYMVISSRFHGVANALSSSVPCLATSWSHKYQKLLEEYNQNDNILDLANLEKTLAMINTMLESHRNNEIRMLLTKRNEIVKKKNQEMWNAIFGTTGV